MGEGVVAMEFSSAPEKPKDPETPKHPENVAPTVFSDPLHRHLTSDGSPNDPPESGLGGITAPDWRRPSHHRVAADGAPDHLPDENLGAADEPGDREVANRTDERDAPTVDGRRSDQNKDLPGTHPAEFAAGDDIPSVATKPAQAHRDGRSDDPRRAHHRVEQISEKESASADGEKLDLSHPPDTDRPREAVPTHRREGFIQSQYPRGEQPYPALVDTALQETLADVVAELDLTTQWHRLLEQRMSRVEHLVHRVRNLPVVRVNPELGEELDALRLADPDSCLHTVSHLLAEVLKLRSAPDGRDGFDGWTATLDALATEAGRLLPEAVVAPDARGHIDGRMPAGPVMEVEVRDSVGVMWGVQNRLNVEHLCVVKSPVIELAELIEMDDGEPVFNWSAWRFNPTHTSDHGPAAGGVAETSLHHGFWANIWNCTGITVGDRNMVNLTYVHRLTSCPVNLVPLLRDPQVRADLAQCRDDSPENAQGAQEARHRLPTTVAQAVRAIDVSRLVSGEEIAALAARTRQPQVRGRAGALIIRHGVGVALGIDPAVTWSHTTRIDPIRVR
ncbi:hypothetical protein [Micromonospora sp. NPDC000442]|uniref:hypothetical protein n=1 Tax=Micromonospora sp. NPDC000442 TaxID=3364217 RepID=UPI003684EA9D